MSDLGMRVYEQSPAEPDPELANLIAQANASLPGFSVIPGGPQPHFAPKGDRYNAGGWTLPEGEVVVANSDRIPRTNILAHESMHNRFNLGGGAPKDWKNINARRLASGMERMQNPSESGKLWGAHPNSSPEEQIASIAGYEGSLPRGTSILNTNLGRMLLKDPEMRDYYLHHSSKPYGGIWEGQIKDESAMTRALRALGQIGRRFGFGIASY